MALTVPSDRPFAIKGLEARLVHTFGGTGRYGVLQIYLHRCLLWKRAGPFMKPITSFSSETIPSWSWMAYEGGIRYIDAPGSDVNWMNDVFWSPNDRPSDYDGMSTELQAPVWGLVDPRDEDITLDDERPLDPQMSKCVIIGVSKRQAEEGGKLYYVLIITPVFVDDKEVWKRRGVGIMKKQYIALDWPMSVGCIQ